MAPPAPLKHILPKLKAWRLEVDVERLGWLTFDLPQSPVNRLSRAALGELEILIRFCEDMAAGGEIAGLIVQSAKQAGFAAATDFSEYDDIGAPGLVAEALRRTQALFQRIEHLPVPVAASLHGDCLGGGLDLALACHWRVAVAAGTAIGFPEAKVGLIPAFGGTGRALRLAGPLDAMRLMMTGEPIGAEEAYDLGLVDAVVRHRDNLRWSARSAVLNRQKSVPASWPKQLVASDLLRRRTAKTLRAETAKLHSKERFPAPFALVDLFEAQGKDAFAMNSAATDRFASLAANPASINLRRVAALTEKLRQQGLDPGGRPGTSFRRIHVSGAGPVGGEVAAWCALQGFGVTLQDLDNGRIQPALERARDMFVPRLRSPVQVEAAMARLEADVDGRGVGRADAVVEAVADNVEIKLKTLRAILAQARPDAVIGSASPMPLDQLAEGLDDPDRLIGLHFPGAVDTSAVVEVVRTKHSSAAAIARGCALVVAIGKTPVVVSGGPGALILRVMLAYMVDAVRRVETGESVETIDAAAVAFGMPSGPIELIDTFGLDRAFDLAKQFGLRLSQTSRLATLVSVGRLGRKSGEGFYRWQRGRPVRGRSGGETHHLAGLGRELVAPLVEECEKCVKERVVTDADTADIALVLGGGFPAFLGGPLRARADGKA